MENNYSLYIFSDVSNDYERLDIEDNDMLVIFSLENIQDVTTRKDNITKGITLKGTKQNNIALGHLYNISSYSESSYHKDIGHNFVRNRMVRCILLENNIEIINGKLLINEVNINNSIVTYDCTIIGNQVSFFGELSDRELSELNSLNDVIPFTISQIRNTWSFPLNYKYIFGQLDYGIDERPILYQTDEEGQPYEVVPNWHDSSYDLRNFRPQIWLKSYFDAIFCGWRYDTVNEKYTQFDANGYPLNLYNYSIETLGNDNFNNIFISNNEEQLTYDYTGILTSLPTINHTYSALVLGGESIMKTPNILFPINTSSINTSYFESYEIPKGFIAYQYESKTEGRFLVKSTAPTNAFKTKDKYLRSKITITGSITLPSDWKGTYHFGLCDVSEKKEIMNMRFAQKIEKPNTGVITFPINYESDVQDIAGDYILAIRRENQLPENINVDTDIVVTNLNIKFGDINVISKIPYALGDNINLFNTIPKGVKVKDFVKSVMTMFNLYIVSDPNSRNGFIIKPYSKFYKDVINLNREIAIDWTEKIDFENYSLKGNQNLPKTYTFKFAEDTDIMNEKYKQETTKSYGNITVVDSEGLQGEKQVEVLFAPTINLSHSMNKKNLPVIYKGDGFLQGKKKPFNSKIRLMYHNGEVITDQYSIHHKGTEVTKLSTYQYSSMLKIDPITQQATESLLFELPQYYYTLNNTPNDFSIALFDRYHKEQLNTLTNNNIIIAEFKAFLTESDIADISNTFQKPIYIQSEYGNAYFKLLEVEYTNNYTASNIKMMKII